MRGIEPQPVAGGARLARPLLFLEAMDRPLQADVHRRRLRKQVAAGVLVVAAPILALIGLRKLITPSLDADRIRTAIVEEGPIEATISASGTVVPQFEEVISSPIDSRVLEVLRRPGEAVRKGDPILVLDTSAARLELSNLDEQVALKQNERKSEELSLRESLITLEGRYELKQVDLESRRARHDRTQRLFDEGLSSKSELMEARLDIRRTEIELRQLEESMDNLRLSTRSDLERLELEMNILVKQQQDRRRVLDLATAKSTRDGVLTFVTEEEGGTVRQGDVLARVADLDRFHVNATVSDVYSSRLSQGSPARIEVDGAFLDGTLRTVLPTIQAGTVTLLIELADPSHVDLRSNLRVDVYIITDSRQRALKVRKGPFANGSGVQQAFVVRNGRAHRAEIEIGISSFDDLEVLAGVEAGDEIVISDMTEYMHMEQVPID